MSIFNEVLEKSKLNKELIGLRKYKDDDVFWCGYVVDFNETLVKIQHFTKFGKTDGLIIAMLGSIKSIDYNDDYLNALQVVIDFSKEIEKEEKFDFNLSDNEEWDFDTIKKMVGNYQIMTSIEINNGDIYSGFIEKFTETDFVIRCISSMGRDDGTSIFKIEDITGFRINDIDNRKRTMLFNWRNSKM